MNELIKVENKNGELLVSARDLHNKLGIGKDFTTWVKFISKYGFEENIDYNRIWIDTRVHKNGDVAITSVEPTEDKWAYKSDYILKIDCAKEICMIQRTDIGRECRKYFLECERKLKEVVDPKAQLLLEIYNGGQGGVLAAKQLTEIEVREATQPLLDKIEEDKPKVTFADRVLRSKDNILVRQLAKIASDEGYKIGERKLYNKLREWGYVLKGSTEPSQRAIDSGYFVIKVSTIDTPYGIKETKTTLVTPKGQIKIVEKLLKELNK